MRLQKAYLISLCLSAQRVLAENTSEEAAVQEKALLDQVLEAVKNPSADHMQIYIGLGLLLAVIAAVIMTAMKGEETQKVNLDELADEKPRARKRAGLKKPEGAAS